MPWFIGTRGIKLPHYFWILKKWECLIFWHHYCLGWKYNRGINANRPRLFGQPRHKSCFKSQKYYRVSIYLVYERTETYRALSKHESALVSYKISWYSTITYIHMHLIKAHMHTYKTFIINVYSIIDQS